MVSRLILSSGWAPASDTHGSCAVFLAFGESQAKERSCWFFSEDEDLTADQIRAWMGDFTSEKVRLKASEFLRRGWRD